MRTGGLTSSAPGEVSDIILDLKAQAVAGNTLHASILPFAPFAKRYFMPFIGGVYLGNTERSENGEPIQVTATVGQNVAGMVYFEDVGDWASLPDGAVLPDGGALELEALVSKRIRFTWANSYNLTATHGDTQLSGLAVTGAVRRANVGVHPTPTRGRLYYTIQRQPLITDADFPLSGGNGGTSSSTQSLTFPAGNTRIFTVTGNQVDFYVGQTIRVAVTADPTKWMDGVVSDVTGNVVTIEVFDHAGGGPFSAWTITTESYWEYAVRFFADARLVAETEHAVQAIANTAAEVLGSGLSVAFNLTYTADQTGLEAYFDLRWPAAYAINYSTGTLTFPRTPEHIEPDSGDDSYAWTTPTLAAGTYNCDVLQIDDEGSTETTGIPSAVAQTISAAPAAPTITSVAAAAHLGGTRLTVNWTVGEAGCTFMTYYGDLDSPVNVFAAGSPTPIGPSALNATSSIIDLATVPAGYDFTADYATLVTLFGVAASNLFTVFALGEGDLTPDLLDLDTVLAAVTAFGDVTLEDFETQYRIIELAGNALKLQLVNLFGLGLADADWKAQVGPYLGLFLAQLGICLDNDPRRYYLDGYTFAVPGDLVSITQQSAPLVRNATIRIIVRATKGGVQERHDTAYLYEFDGATGNILPAQPNKPQIETVAVTGGDTLNLHVSVLEDDALAVANSVLLYVAADADAFDFTSSDGSVALGATFANYHAGDITFTFPSTGWYKFCCRSFNTAGNIRSPEPTGDEIKYIYIGQTVGAVRSFAVNVQSGLGV